MVLISGKISPIDESTNKKCKKKVVSEDFNHNIFILCSIR
jgi:hypothetical protein